MLIMLYFCHFFPDHWFRGQNHKYCTISD